jgi:hypothetical protein
MGVFVESDRSSSFQPGHVTDQQLLERWHRERDAAAREALVRRHLSLARKLAGRYSHTQDGPSESIFMPRNPRVRPVIAFATGRFKSKRVHRRLDRAARRRWCDRDAHGCGRTVPPARTSAATVGLHKAFGMCTPTSRRLRPCNAQSRLGPGRQLSRRDDRLDA